MLQNAYAKLNILLNVHGKYFNGYHSIGEHYVANRFI